MRESGCKSRIFFDQEFGEQGARTALETRYKSQESRGTRNCLNLCLTPVQASALEPYFRWASTLTCLVFKRRRL